MKSFRSLTPAVFAALIAGGTVTAVWTGARFVRAQEVGPTPPGAADSPKKKTEPEKEPEIKEDPEAVELIRSAQKRLVERASVQARIRETVFLGDQRQTTEGTYASGTFPMVNVRYKVKVGSTIGILNEVCDGSVVHTKREITKDGAAGTDEKPTQSVALPKSSAGETEYTRCDVLQVVKAIDDNKRTPSELMSDAGIGGLPATIASLQRCMKFESVRQSQTKSGTFTIVEGRWNPARLEEISKGFGANAGALRQLMPERVAVYLDPQTLFPSRIVYLRQMPGGESPRPVLAVEFLDVRLDEPVPMDLFVFALPSGAEEKDETAEYISILKPKSQGQPSQGLPAELLPK
jgi:hypothetical protein